MTYNERRLWLTNALEGVEGRVRALRFRVRTCCEDPEHEQDHDWPTAYPAAVDLSAPFHTLLDGLNDLERGVIQTERQYRADVLRWLLAETEAAK